ncbi:MAG: hypothetical protein J5824_07290 [Lachnospiraceae bacterium]|nr:hypothetical protein [Lachnospiraceae bacterium]
MKTNLGYKELIGHMGMSKLPKGLEDAFAEYCSDDVSELMPHEKYEELLAPYALPEDKKLYLDRALEAVEADESVLYFSRFFVWDMCSMRNKYDIDNYTELMPACLGEYNEAYAFLVLLACVPAAEEEMVRRGVPKEYYEDIPHRMIRDQIKRYLETGRINVEDLPWKMNFYTLTIFLLDRFLFIPYQHGERFRMYRNLKNGHVIALNESGCVYDDEGQLLDWGFPEEDDEHEDIPEPDQKSISDEYSERHGAGEPDVNPDGLKNGHFYCHRRAAGEETFTTSLTEDEKSVTGYYMNPLGYTENRTVTLNKNEYEQVLGENDWLIALHIPGGEGYTPERMHSSMKMALEFFAKYYPELDMKGFWSSSWLYDERLRFILGDGRNITKVQDLMYRYSDGEDGSMLYVHLFKDMKNSLEDYECTTTLQKEARRYLMEGRRFCTTGMMILKDEALSGKTYYTTEDKADWEHLVRTRRLRA